MCKGDAPELFEEQPDLLFQLVTMIAPEVTFSNQDACHRVAWYTIYIIDTDLRDTQLTHVTYLRI